MPVSPPAEDPESVLSPEKLTFKEKLALHKKAADDVPPPPHLSRHGSGGEPKTRSFSNINPTVASSNSVAPPPVNRTSSDENTSAGQ